MTTPAALTAMLMDKLNDIERSAAEGIDLTEDINEAYTLADHISDKAADLESQNIRLRELVEAYGMIANDAVYDYDERDLMLAEANETAFVFGIEVGA